MLSRFRFYGQMMMTKLPGSSQAPPSAAQTGRGLLHQELWTERQFFTLSPSPTAPIISNPPTSPASSPDLPYR